MALQLLITPVIAQDSGLNGSFNDMNQSQLTDKQVEDSKNFNHTGQRDRIVGEKCTGTKCSADPSEVNKNGSVIGGTIGALVEDNLGRLYAVIFGGGGALISALSSITGANSASGGAGMAVGALGGTGDKDKKSGWTVITDENGNREKDGAKTKAAKTTLAEEKAAAKIAKENNKRVEDSTVKTKKINDYCAQMAIASEVGAAVNQYIGQKKIEDEPVPAGTEQKAAIDKTGRLHKTRANTSLIQAVGFTGVASCYAINMATNKAMVIDTKTILKMAAATAIGTIYYLKMAKHKRAQKELQRISKLLPVAGDCNPYTQTTCFCSEPSSETLFATDYQKACLPSVLAARTDTSPLVCLVAQADGTYKSDAACLCKKNNSCVKANLAIMTPNFSMAQNLMNAGQNSLNAALNSNFNEGQLNSAYLANAALNNRVLKAADSKMGTTKLDGEQKKLADELSKILPPNIAAQLASSPNAGLPEGISNSIASGDLGMPESAKKAINEVDKKVSYGGGGSGFGQATSPEDELVLPPMPGAEEAKQGGTEIISFAEQAVENADISKAPETPIFDIISYRYRQSAWNKLTPKEEPAP